MTYELRIHLTMGLSEAELAMLQHRLIAVPGVLSAHCLESERCVVVRLRGAYDTVLAVKRLAGQAMQSFGTREETLEPERSLRVPSEAHIG